MQKEVFEFVSPPSESTIPFFYHQILLLNNVKRLETALK